MTNDHRSKFSNLSNWKEEAWKKIRASTGFENCLNWKIYCDDHSSLSSTTAVQNELFHYSSHHFTPHRRYELNKLTSLPMCGFIVQLVEQRTGNAEVTGSNPIEALIFFFQASSFQLLKLENLLQWSFFTFIMLIWGFNWVHWWYLRVAISSPAIESGCKKNKVCPVLNTQ